MRRGLVIPALVAAVLALAACGDAAEPSAPETTGPESSATAESTREATQAPTSTELETELIGFTSPGGDVGCMIDATFVRCDVSEPEWTPPPRPADCEFDYGQGISMAPGEAPEFVCAGDTALGGGKPLALGTSISAGALACDSARAGITCRDEKSGRGFTIARAAYTIF